MSGVAGLSTRARTTSALRSSARIAAALVARPMAGLDATARRTELLESWANDTRAATGAFSLRAAASRAEASFDTTIDT